MVKSVVATGKVEPITKVEIKSKANGIIQKLNVDVDSRRERRRRPRRARPGTADGRAARRGGEPAGRPRGARPAPRPSSRRTSSKPKGRTRAFAERAYDRARSLFAQNLIAQSALDDAHSAVEVAQNRKRAAESQLAVSRREGRRGAGPGGAGAGRGRPRRRGSRPTRRSARRSAGTVLSRDVELGSPVSSILNLGANATLVMTLGDIDQVFVRGKVDEADIGRVRLGQPARIRVETFKDKVFNGQVTQISPMGVEKDNVTKFEVKVSIDNPGKELKANMTANAEIVARGAPERAHHPGGGGHLRRAEERVRRASSIPARRTAAQDAGEARRRQRHEDPGRRRPEAGRPDRSAVVDRRAANARSHHPILPEPARQQAAQLPDDVRDPLGDDLGRRAVGHRRRLPARQRQGAARARQEHRHHLGRAHQPAGRRRARGPPDLPHASTTSAPWPPSRR